MTEAFREFVLTEASRLYGFDLRGVSVIPAHEGGRNLTYHTGDGRILRVSYLNDRTEEDCLAETEYVHFLALGGASVADVLPSANGKLVEMVKRDGEECAVSVFETAKGDQIAAHGYRYREGAPIEEYWYNCGRTLGKLHALSMDYQPLHRRFDFFEKYNEAYFDALIPDELSSPFLGEAPVGRAVKEKLSALLDKLRALNVSRETYGMLHFDFSDGNYNIDYTDGTITVFDFDNCRMGPYLFDLANLWSHGVGWIMWSADAEERRSCMKRYMSEVIRGYRAEKVITDAELELLPLLIEAVRMENIIDEFEVQLHEEGVLGIDGEQAYRLKGLLGGIPYMGFFEDDYDPDSPFDLDP